MHELDEHYREFIEDATAESEAEWRAYEIIAMFDNIESEICDFYDAMVHVFGGHVWFDAYGDSHYCNGNTCADCKLHFHLISKAFPRPNWP